MENTINNVPLSWRHIKIVAIASLGQLIGTGLATLVSVIIPLYQLTAHPELSSGMQGLVGAMDLLGIVVGSVVIGKLSDQYGYLLFFRLCPILVCAASFVALFFPSISVLIVCLFIMGVGIGGEYSLDSDYISSLMPDKWKSVMVGVAKAASALGNIGVAGACFLIVSHWTNPDLWPRLLWIIIAISGLMIVLRIRFWESPKWLASHGRNKQAAMAVEKFLGDEVGLSSEGKSADTPKAVRESWGTFIGHNWKKVIFTGVPWACEGLGVYGIGVFLPILVMALGIEHVASEGATISHVANSVEITLWISCIILPGFVLGLLLLNKVDGVRMQILGFIMSALCLSLLLASYYLHWDKWISIGAFMGFELFLNMGPHLMTYILPSKVYPEQIRGQGSGMAASIGKVGAVLGVFFIPILLKSGGTDSVLIVSIIVMLVGGLVTWIFKSRRQVGQ